MSKARAGFSDFVETRGASLARSASLLELDAVEAEHAVVGALAWSSRHWGSLARDGNADEAVRQHLYTAVTTRWRRARTLDAVPAPSAITDDAPAERAALASLTNRQRAALVLTAFDSLSNAEVAALLRMKGADSQRLTEGAAAQFRRSAGVTQDAPLLPLLNLAASRVVPTGLVPAALAASRSSGRRYLAIAAAAVAVVAVAAMALLPSSGNEPEADPMAASIEQWGIPPEPPVARKLPSLVDEPIETASMAYISRGIPVVTDAVSGAARTVLSGRPIPEWYGLGTVSGPPRRASPWTQAVLSPDGGWLLLVQGRRGPAGVSDEDRPGATGELYLVRIATGEVTRLPDANPAAAPQGAYAIADTVLAWAPGGGAFACVCDRSVRVFDLEPTTPRTRMMSSTEPGFTDVAWGAEGLLGRRADGEWVLRTGGGINVGQLGRTDGLAASISTPPVYLTVGITSIYALGADSSPDGGHCVLWTADLSTPTEIAPLPEEDGKLCTPVALQPGRSGVLLVLGRGDVMV